MNPASPSNAPPPAPRFWDGFVAVAPLVPGVAAFALVYGVLARQAGLSLLATTTMSALVFAALLAPPLLAPEGAFGIGLSAAAAIPAAAVAWRTRQVFPTILAGIRSYWLLRWLVG